MNSHSPPSHSPPPPSPTEEAPEKSSPALRGFLWNAIVDGLCPFLVYYFVRKHTTEFAAIGWSTAPPALNSVLTLIRKRHVDIIGVIVILGLLASLALLLFGGSPRLLLVRDSLITGVIGLVFLVSLLFPRPLLFHVLRQLTTAHDPAEAAAWDTDYDHSRFKFGLPRMTAVWGVMLVGEALLRTVTALNPHVSVRLFLAVWPVVNLGMYVGTMLWSFSYGRRVQEWEDRLLGGTAGTL